MGTSRKIALILAGLPLFALGIAGYVNEDWRVWLFIGAPICFLASLFDSTQRAKLHEKATPSALLVGLSIPAFLLTRAEIDTWGKPIPFIATNASGVALIVALAFFRDKRDAKKQEILKDL